MKLSLAPLLFTFALAAATPLSAGPDSVFEHSTANAEVGRTAFEFEAEYGYIGDGTVERSFRRVENFDEDYFYARALFTPLTKVGILRLGATYERFDFGLPELARVGIFPVVRPETTGFILGQPQLPETLQSISAVIGLDTRFSDSILFRIEFQPGFYGTDHLGGDTFHVPLILGGTYIINSNFQLIFGASVDYERKYPVFPGGGFRWRFAPQWVLNAAAPTPRLEFQATKNFTIYGGADLKGSVSRMDKNFGVTRGDSRLNNAVLTYSEVRTGAGIEWKITPDVMFSVEGGYVPYREFDYHRADIRYEQDKGAPYGAASFHAAF
ncbi:MAG: DUF6268 family outer membrane beta-barrel protein [Chthoniobacterales bacterium]